MAVNIARGGGKKFTAEVSGLKELEANIANLVKAMGPDSRQVGYGAVAVVGEAAAQVKQRIVSAALAARVPKEIVRSVFSFNDPSKAPANNQRVTALVGVSKKATMREWYAREGARSRLTRTGRASKKEVSLKASAGKRIAMSLATMFEFGTSRMRARPAIRSAIQASRSQVLSTLASGYRRIIESYTKL